MKLTRRILHHRARPVDFKYPARNQQLAQQLFDFMLQENGIGLAATQVGIKDRVFVMQVDGQKRACFNPQILEQGNRTVEFAEGCLSFKGDECILKRPDKISVEYQDYKGDWYREILVGLASRCFQHELDHLDGITMWDRLKEQNAK